MNSSKKIIAVISALIIALSSLSACSLPFGKDKPTTEPDTQISAKEPTIENTKSTEENTTEEESTEATSEEEEDKTVQFADILKLIRSFPAATPGSTEKSVDIALKLINLTERTDETSELMKAFNIFKEDLSEDDAEEFENNIYEIDAIARKLISGKTETLKAYIEDSEEKFDEGKYTLEKYERVFNFMIEK